MYIYNCIDTSLKAEPFPIKIPHDYDVRFKSNAGPDSDGFTNWEEYRGFVLDTGHVRGDSIKKDFFLLAGYPNRQQIQTMLNNTGTGDWIVHEENPPGEVYQSFTWLDTKIFKYSDSSSNLIPNELCFPGIFPDTFVAPEYFNGQWHQGIIPRAFQELNISHPEDNPGTCTCWSPCKGCGSTDSIRVYLLSIVEQIKNFVDGYNLPSTLAEMKEEEYKNRVWIHELGHALELDQVSEGSWNCVMRVLNEPPDPENPGYYLRDSDLPIAPDNWTTFHFDSPLNYCGGTPGLRR